MGLEVLNPSQDDLGLFKKFILLLFFAHFRLVLSQDILSGGLHNKRRQARRHPVKELNLEHKRLCVHFVGFGVN